MNEEGGCHFCFGSLISYAHQNESHKFVKCSHCEAAYHTECWHQYPGCLRCNNTQAEPFEILPSPLPETLTKIDTFPIKPSRVVYSIVGIGIVFPDSGYVILEGFARFIYRNPILSGIGLIITLSGCSCLTCIICAVLSA